MTDDTQSDRRDFLRRSAIVGAALAAGASTPLAQEASEGPQTSIPRGDIDILRLFAALEILETDLWQQYNELGGIQDGEVPGGSGNKAYTDALKVLDGDMDQYVHDNTDDEFTHFDFINAYLKSKGAQPVDLERFRTLPGSQATGAATKNGKPKKRLTNLMQLTVDTSWWTRYRDALHNPDLDPTFVFPQAVPDLAKGQHPAIPRDDKDLTPGDHLQAIANTAGFHFATIEQGGSSLYPTLALKANHPEVLRILLSIGPSETMHFQTWQDKAGNAPPLTDPTTGLVFPDLNNPPFGGPLFQTNLIMPEPCPFLSRKLPRCSIIRPVSTDSTIFGAQVAVKFLTDMGLFIGQPPTFFAFINDLAKKADAARRIC
jgi:Ferritin-like domain